MMRSAGDLVRDLLARGVALWFEGERLRFRGPQGALTPELRAELGARRDEVLASLRAEAAARETTCALSYNQRSLWLVHREDPASAAYNVAFCARVVSPVNVAALRQALQALVDRHAILRTTYPVVAGLPVQRIAGSGVAALEVHGVAGIGEDELRRRVEASYRLPFDLETGPVLRSELFSLADADHVLLITAHHIAVDGLSQMQLLDELRSLYAEATGGPPAGLTRAETDYADFTRWQAQMLEGPEGRRLVDYWRAQLAEPRARIELPADRRRQARRSARAATLAVALDAGLSDGLRQLARNESTTLYVVLLAAFKTLLFRYTGTQDVIVGTPTFGRDRPETTRVVGDFVNTVALRSQLDAGMSLRELLAQVRRTLLDALEAQDCPFPRVVEALHPARDPGRSPLFETMFVLQNFERLRELAPMLMPTETAGSVDFGGLRLRQFALAQQLGQFVLTLEAIDIAGPLALHFKYDADLFDESTISRLAGHLRNLLAGIVADPGGALGGFGLLSGAERRASIEGAGAVAGRDAPAWTLPERFEAQVRRRPEAIALTFAGMQLSYAELNRRANRLAHRLREAGVGRESLVGLCCEPSIDLVVGLVAIVKAGGAYVPIDLAYPPDRVAFMLADAKVRVLVTRRGLEARLPGYDGVAIAVDEALADRPDTDPAPCNAPDDLAYVIYTSGSTGRPKGAMLPHRAVQRLFTATERWFGFGPDDVWTLFHSVAFDFSVWELWGALLYGGRLVVVPHATTRAPDAFRQLLEDERVTVLNQTPSAFGQLMQADAATGAPRPTSLRYVIFGGEALELQRLRPWFERHGDRKPRLVNMYGITETCVHVTYRPIGLEDLEAAQGSVIGEPIGDLRVHILDAALEPTPPGVMGEMYVGGPGLARGYLERPDLTAARFVPDPFVPGERLYRTGDLARRRASGELEYLGRIDLQVKIRGFRIELGEIEAVLGRCECVRQSVVVVREDSPGDRRLVAYLVADGKADLPAIRARLAEALPAYMVPSAFVTLDALPLTANGKIDGAALPAPQGAMAEGERLGAPPATDTERMLAGIWAEVLGAEVIGRDDDFFELGGHSLLLVKVHSALRTRLGHDLPMAELFRHTTVAAQAAYLDQPREELTL